MSEKSKEFLPHSPLGERIGDVNSGLNEYPALARLFEKNEPDRLNKLRDSFENATRTLDDIVRRGTPDEAERASKALEAIVLTLEFLDSLESGGDI